MGHSRLHHTALLLLLLSLAGSAFSQCDQKVDAPSYSVCFPAKWATFKDSSLDQISGCNKRNGECTGNGGGFPLPGRVFIFIAPAEKLPIEPKPHSIEEIVRMPPFRPDEVEITAIALAKSSEPKRCLVARSLLKPFGVWNEVYGIEVDSRLFRAWVQYGNEPGKMNGYREAIIHILSSISLGKPVQPFSAAKVRP
jgi:hypothetical protein